MSPSQDFIEFTLKTDRHSLFAKALPVEQPVAFCCIIHGFGEHCGRYDHVAMAFAERHINVYLMDLPGHGKSDGKRGNIRALNDFMLAIDALMEHGRAENPQLPYFMYGHSMGGGLLLRYLTLVESPPLAAVVTSPWLKLVHAPGALQIILARMALVLGLNLSQESRLDPEFLSRDLQVGKDYKNDPLTHGKMTPRTFFAMQDNGNYLLEMQEDFRNPILLAHGMDDQITSSTASRKLTKKHQAITFKEWPDLRHETHNELNKKAVIAFYLKWLLQKL
ncbi:MAG: lysophospholipase [Cytophagaceae bacterium]|nr:lysophospholipase [Cytophagaceae bacterium]